MLSDRKRNETRRNGGKTLMQTRWLLALPGETVRDTRGLLLTVRRADLFTI